MERRLPPISAWYLAEAAASFAAVIWIVATLAASAAPILIAPTGLIAQEDMSYGGQNRLKKFSSYEELENFVRANVGYYDSGRWVNLPLVVPLAAGEVRTEASDLIFSVPTEWSTTNIQVEGVDEADIMKTDGRYLYVISGKSILILAAYPPEEARVLSQIELDGTPLGIFVNGDRLVVFESRWVTLRRFPDVVYEDYSQKTIVAIYDISDKENPILIGEISLSGSYFDSRMIGDYVYVVVNMPVGPWNDKIVLPEISSGSRRKTIPPTEIYYFDDISYPYVFAIIAAIDVRSAEELEEKVFLTTQAHNMYVSLNNIYITYTNGWYTFIDRGWETEKTIVHKISIADGKIEYKSQGEVPGHVLNQFSMDEYQGHFRIATTTGEVWGRGKAAAKNHVYILDEKLNIVGRLEDLAPGERIYSARFMGNRAYLVTFKKIDPLLVIDLKDPYNPRVLGELKIPGYSDYLHPYDETHLIGVGKDTYDMGDFAWYQGVKIALFDVSDPENPREISKYVIGDRGTDSYALQDHKAFLFSRSKNLLVIPILLAEIDEKKYPWGVPAWAHGEYTWQGAYVFNISLTDGLVLKGGITHSEDDAEPGWGWYSSRSVKRSLYIDDVLYTISDESVKMNDLESLDEIGKISLYPPYEVEMTGWRGDHGFQSMGAELGSVVSLFAAAMVAGGLLRRVY